MFITELRAEAGSKTYQTRTVALAATKAAIAKYLGDDARVQLLCNVTEGNRYFYVVRIMGNAHFAHTANLARAGFFVIN